MWTVFLIFSRIFSYLPNPFFRILWQISNLLTGRIGAVIRYILIAKRLKKCGVNVFFGPNVYIESPEKLILGSNVSIHHQCTLICAGEIEIGDDVAIAHGSSLISTNHTWNNIDQPIKYNPLNMKKILICNDVWVGCGVRILAGSIIQSRTVIAAGAVVSKELTSNAIYGGIPARIIKRL